MRHFVGVAFRNGVAVKYEQRSEKLDAGFDNSARCPLPLSLIFAILRRSLDTSPTASIMVALSRCGRARQSHAACNKLAALPFGSNTMLKITEIRRAMPH